MKHTSKYQNEIGRVCFTSVQAGTCSLYHIHDPAALRACLVAEYGNMNRISMINAIQARIRKVEKVQEENS